jgi:hypothetical protein
MYLLENDDAYSRIKIKILISRYYLIDELLFED